MHRALYYGLYIIGATAPVDYEVYRDGDLVSSGNTGDLPKGTTAYIYKSTDYPTVHDFVVKVSGSTVAAYTLGN